MWALKFKAQPTNVFFATVNQMLGSSSQLPTTAERAVIKSLNTVQTTKQCSAIVGSWEDPPNFSLTVAKNAFVGWALNFRVRMLLKGAVSDVKKQTLTIKCACDLKTKSNGAIVLSSLLQKPRNAIELTQECQYHFRQSVSNCHFIFRYLTNV